MKATPLSLQVTTLATFLLPALALWVQTGPSYSAALLLLGTLCFVPHWIKVRPAPGTWMLALLLLAMAALWCELTTQQGAGRLDRPLKWALGALCLFYATACPPRPAAFFLGLPIGCMGMGALALWQVFGQGMERATGYTNAIPWGDTALLLACFSGVYAAVFWHERRWPWRMLWLVAVACAAGASLLSQSRGGWLALGLAFPVLMLVARQLRPRLFMRLLALLGALTLALMLVLGGAPHLRERVSEAATEIGLYFEGHSVNTSLGIRLEQYRLAVALIGEKPWQGWSRQGFVQETHRRVEAGEYDASILGYQDFIHNEFLDIWVKTGIAGVLLQLALYGVPLFLFWPTAQRMGIWATPLQWRQALALRVMGILMPAMYLGFGMTMQFFAHNSGTVFFIFCLLCLWAALQGLEHQVSGRSGA